MEQQNYRITRLHSGDIILNISGDYRKARKIGTIKDDTLYCNKNERHVLRINNGIGICYDVLRDYDFRNIEINFLGKKLKTTREYFLNHSRFFQFGNYEKQKFLPIDKFGMDKCIGQQPETPIMKQSIEQQDLFAGVN